MCVERELVVGNTLFKKMIQDNRRVVDRAMMDYWIVSINIIG